MRIPTATHISLVLLFLSLYCPWTAEATTGIIAGYVSNDLGVAIVGAEISGPQDQDTTVSGAWGYYSLSLTPGTYTITASASGYQETSVENVTVSASEQICLDFTLSPLSIEKNYPSLGELGTDINIEISGSGFDSATRLALMPDSGNLLNVVGQFKSCDLFSAVAIAMDGTIAYVIDQGGDPATNLGMLYIVDVSNPTAPKQLGELPLLAHGRDVAINGSCAYVTHGDVDTGVGGLLVIDVSDPANPRHKGSLTLNVAYGVTVVQNTAYVVDGICDGSENGGNLHAIDVSDPLAPDIAWSLDTPFSHSCGLGIEIEGSLAYVANEWEGLKIIDIDSASTTFKQTLNSPVYGEMEARGVDVAGGYAFVACEDNGLWIYNVSDPANPILTGKVDTLVWARNVEVVDNIAYVADFYSGLSIIDVTNAESPEIIGSVDTEGGSLDLVVQNKLAYLADDWQGLSVINVSNPEKLALVGTLPGNGAHSVILDGITLYMTEWEGLRKIDVSDPSAPSTIHMFTLNQGCPMGIAMSGTTMYVAAYDGDLQIVHDLDQNTDNTTSVNIDNGMNYSWSTAVNNDFILVGDGDCENGTSGGLNLIDRTDSSYASQQRMELGGCVSDIVVLDDTHAYVTVVDGDTDGSNDNGLKIIDIDPANISGTFLTVVGAINTGGNPHGLDIDEGYAYIADGWEGVKIIDITDPTTPQLVGKTGEFGHEAWSIEVKGDSAYVADFDAGVYVIDITDKTRPLIVGSVDTPGFAEDITVDVAGGIAHVADSFAGLTTVALPFEFTANISQVEKNLINATLPSPRIEGHYIIRSFHDTLDIDDTLLGAITFTSSADLLSSKAIIVAGGGPSASNTIWTETMAYANQAYANLLYQGYRHEDIYYLTDQADAAGRDDEATALNLQNGITSWADTSDLLLYLVDHGVSNEFLIRSGTNEEYVSAVDLDGWLDSLQTAHPGGKTLVVYDACRSGSFIARMSPPTDETRITLTSSTAEQVAYFLTDEHSFSAHFWSTFSGASGDKINLADAYNRAAETMAGYQTAQFDANGNGVPNESEDAEVLADVESTIYALRRRYQNQGLDKPVIATIADNVVLSASSGTTTDLWAANVYDLDHDNIVRVWAEIIAPDYNPDQAGDTVTSIPEVVLSGPNGDGIYTATYSEFTVTGTYVITFYAEDERGIISLPRIMLVEQTAGTAVSVPDPYEVDNTPAEAGIIIVNGPGPENHTFHNADDQDWVLFYGIGDEVYKIRAGDPSLICDPAIAIYRQIDNTLEQSCNASGIGEKEECIWTCPSNGFYYLQLSNGSSHYGANVYYSLRLYNPIALEFPGYVTGYVTSNDSEISGASLTAGSGSGVSADNGAFIISQPTGSVTVTANKSGYHSESCTTTVTSGGHSSCDINLQVISDSIVAPTLAIAIDSGIANVSWNSVANATGYTLYYAPYPYEGEHTIGHLDMGSETLISAELPPGSAFYVAVTSWNDDVESGYSNIGLISMPD